MKRLQNWSLWALTFLSVSFPTQAVNLYFRAGTTTCIYNGTTSQTLQTAAGSTLASATFSAATNTFSFYSAVLTNGTSLSASKTAGGLIGVRNDGNADFQCNARQTIYDYDPVTGTQIQILAGSTSGWVLVGKNGKTAQVTLPDDLLGGSGYTVPAGHMLKVAVTVTVNITSGINGALIYNSSSKKSNARSYISFPQKGNNWPFGPFVTTPDATIIAPSSAARYSTGNVASVRDAGVGAAYFWTMTNGTITAGQSTPQITWTAGAAGTVGIGVTIVNGCASAGSASVISLTVKTNQTITFDPIPAHIYGDAPFALNATASSGLPVSFNIVSGPASVSGSTLTITGAGTVIVDATQAGDADYNPAITEQSFVVNPKSVTVSGITAANKVYDGLTDAVLNTGSATLVGILPGDDAALDTAFVSGDFTDANVGSGKAVGISGLDIIGTEENNYVLVPPTATADITAAGLTVSGVIANDKVYDGTTAVTLNTGGATLVGVVGSDVVVLDSSSATGVFVSKDAGAARSVTVSGLTISGAGAGNYTLAQPATTANITARSLTISAAAADKVYDGTTTTAASLSDDRVAGDSLTTSYASANFADKNVGAGKAVTVSGISVTGADAGNYTFPTTAATTASITSRPLTVGATAADKVYDGTVAASVALSDDRLGGDSLTISAAAAGFADKNVGNGKTVTATGLSLSGADAGNYTLASASATTTADITARALTVSATAADKVYDGTTAASVTLSDNRLAGDSLATSHTSADFADANVGSGKTVTVSGISISGTDAGNYTANTGATATADITPAILTAEVAAYSKVYDATTAATVKSQTLYGVVAGDSVTLCCGAIDFCDPVIGTNKLVTATGLTLAGASAGNYALASTSANTAANIVAPMVAPVPVRCTKLPNGSIKVEFAGAAGQTYSIQATTSLSSPAWVTLGTSQVLDATGAGSFTDTDAGNHTMRLYRAFVTYILD